MPLLPGKKNIGHNIATEEAANKPRKQAIAIALDVARRTAKASGGAVQGYADGGAPNDAKMARAIQERAMRGLDPTPEQKAYLKNVMAIKEGNSERLSKALPAIANEIGKSILPPVVPGWNTATPEDWRAGVNQKLQEREGMSPGQRAVSLGGEFLQEGAPYFLPEVGSGIGALARTFPKATGALAGGLGMFALPSQAGAGPKEDTMRLQEQLRDQGYYKGPIDGSNGKLTQDALEARRMDTLAREERELEKQRLAVKAAEQQNIATKAQERGAGEQRMREIEGEVPWYQHALRDYGPWIGYGVGALGGMLARKGVVGASNRASSQTAERANSLLSGKGDIPARAASVNQFWSEGAPWLNRSQLPFTPKADAVPAIEANLKAAPSSELYQPNRLKALGADLGVMSGFGAESLYAQEVMAKEANAELAAARDAVAADPSESNIRRLHAALDSKAIAESLTNFGRAGGLTYGAKMALNRREHTRPDINKAEAERTRINDFLANKPYPGAGAAEAGPGPAKASTATPPEPPSPAPPVTPTAPIATAGLGVKEPPKTGQPEAKGPAAPEPSTSQPSAFEPPHPAPEGKTWVSPHLRTRKASKKSGGEEGKIDADTVPRKPAKAVDDPDLLTKGMKRGGAIGRALQVARRAMGGAVRNHVGPITQRADGGRTDTVPMNVPRNGYVLPADICSALGQGDTSAGMNVLLKMFPHSAQPERHQDKEGVPVLAAGGEFVISPEDVAACGNGDYNAGHAALDQFVRMERRKTIQTLKGLPGPAQD